MALRATLLRRLVLWFKTARWYSASPQFFMNSRQSNNTCRGVAPSGKDRLALPVGRGARARVLGGGLVVRQGVTTERRLNEDQFPPSAAWIFQRPRRRPDVLHGARFPSPVSHRWTEVASALPARAASNDAPPARLLGLGLLQRREREQLDFARRLAAIFEVAIATAAAGDG
jgi:hypothetical protein